MARDIDKEENPPGDFSSTAGSHSTSKHTGGNRSAQSRTEADRKQANGGAPPDVRNVKESVLDYLQQGWTLMRLPPHSKEPYKGKSWDAYKITNDNVHTLTERDNLGVIFSGAGRLKDFDLDYQEAADLAQAVGLEGAAFGRGSVIGHYLFDAPGCEAKKFELPEAKGFSYPRELPIHNGEPSRTVLEIRGNDNTFTMFPPSIHPCGEKLEWVGVKRKPVATTAEELRALAGRHAVAAAVLYFYPDDASARYDTRMALTGALTRSGMPAGDVTTYVQQVAKLGGDPKWKEDHTKRTEKRLQEDKKVTGLTKLIEVLQLPSACLGTFYEWLNDAPDETPASDVEPVDLWANFEASALPRKLLPKLIEDYAFTMGETMGSDPAGLAMAALTVCSAAIPDTIKLQMKEHSEIWQESARLWAALVGLPSFKKTPSMTAAAKALREQDRDLLRGYLYELKTYKDLPADERKDKEEPQQTRLCLEDTTIEAAQEVLEGSPNGVLLYQDELSGFFGAMDKYAGARGAAKDRAFWLQSWSGGQYALNRVGRGVSIIPNLSIALLGGIQPDVIRKISADSHDDGFLARMLMVMARPAVMGKDVPTAAVAGEYAKLIEQLTELSPPNPYGLSAYGKFAASGQEPASLCFDDGAQKLRAELECKHLELAQGFEVFNKKLAAAVGKYDGYFGRLCVLWHCIEHADDKDLPPIITENTARRVADFMHGFLFEHATAFYCGVLGLADEHDRLAAVAGYVLAHKVEELTPRDIQRGTWSMHGLKRRDVEGVLEQLEGLGWVSRIPGPRQVLHWIVNPKVHERFAERAAKEITQRKAARELMISDFARRRAVRQ
jgi:Protein of unknown function (DUF3987)/Bifunctional DNA primase/polymerase, N-terminal